MNILISFCNTIDTPGFPNLGVIDLETNEFAIVKLPNDIAQTGMTGLATTSKLILIGLQHEVGDVAGYGSPPLLLAFDKSTFELKSTYAFSLVKDIHSFLWMEHLNTLYIVSTGTDEVIEVLMEGDRIVSEKLFWKPKDHSEFKDTIHLNSIYHHNDDIYVSGFGKKEIEDDWNSARNGFIFNINTNEFVINGLEQPHSIDVLDGQMMFCESKKKKLRIVDQEKELQFSAYTRGLCHFSDRIYVGTSAHRKKSKSTGKANTTESTAGCTITAVDSRDLSILNTWDLNNYGIEIYELMLVDDVSKWPVMVPENYREHYLHSWGYRSQDVIDTIKKLIPPGQKIIVVDENVLDLPEKLKADYETLPFTERDSQYWGPPENDEAAINELTRMIEEGVTHIVIAWPSFWMLDFYTNFHGHLSRDFEVLVQNEDVIIFQFDSSTF